MSQNITEAQIVAAPGTGKFQLLRQAECDNVKAVLAANQFFIAEIDCSQHSTKDAIHARLMQIFNFPDYYGHNLDALADVLPEHWAIGPDENSKIALLFTHISPALANEPVRAEAPGSNWLSTLFEVIMETFQDTETASAFAFFEQSPIPECFTANDGDSLFQAHAGL